MVKNEEGAKTMTVYITGDTYRFRTIFSNSPHYRWDAERRAWAREYDEPINAELAISHVRRLDGIRNRGEFRAEIE
jgi:hypothetical protein